jgi:hypothetical protein
MQVRRGSTRLEPPVFEDFDGLGVRLPVDGELNDVAARRHGTTTAAASAAATTAGTPVVRRTTTTSAATTSTTATTSSTTTASAATKHRSDEAPLDAMDAGILLPSAVQSVRP